MTLLEARALPLPATGLHLAAAVALLAVTLSGLDDPATAGRVLLGVAVLLAATLALAVDEPGADQLDAVPTGYARRVARRLAAAAGAAAAVWLLGLGLTRWRGADVPELLLTLQLLALVALAVAVPAGLRRWRRMPQPGISAGPVLVLFLVAADQLPRGLALMPLQPWGPPWEVAHLRWAALLLAGASALGLVLADPASARLRLPGRRR